MKPISVLIMTRELDQGGVERDAAKIAMGLDRAQFDPHIATFSAKGMRYEELKAAGVPILPLPLKSVISLEALRAAHRLREYIRQHQIKLIHTYDASGAFAIPAGRSIGVPVLIGSQLSYRSLLDPRSTQLLRMSEKLADAVVVNCEAMRRHMIDDEHVPAAKVELCYNGVDTSQFYPLKTARPPELADASLVIGTVCALRQEKGLPLLQEAFAQVLPLNRAMKLVMVGSGMELERLQQNANRLGITAASVFIPATPEVPRWMNAIDIFVLPSYSEAFSNSLLEALACGCAAIGSRVGGMPELTGLHEERGLLFEKGNANDLAVQLTRLIGDQTMREEMGVRAARFARESLSIEIAVRRTSDIYLRWLARNA